MVVVPLGEGQDSVAEAIRAQLSSLPVELRFERGPLSEGTSVAERLSRAVTLAEQYDALLVYWVEPEGEMTWLLYAVDPREQRLLVRSIDLREVGRVGAVEVVAVIARDATQALLHGGSVQLGRTDPPRRPDPTPEPEPGPEPEPEPEPSPAPTDAAPPTAPPAPPAATKRAVWAALGYRGQNLAERLPWEHGIALSMAWMAPWSGLIGLEYVWSPPAEVRQEALFSITRMPISLWAAQRFLVHPVWVDGTLAAMLELSRRLTREAPPGAFLQAGPESGIRFALCPGVRVGLPITREAALFAAADVAIYLRNFRYSIQPPEPAPRVPLLSPHPVSFRATVGTSVEF